MIISRFFTFYFVCWSFLPTIHIYLDYIICTVICLANIFIITTTLQQLIHLLILLIFISPHPSLSTPRAPTHMSEYLLSHHITINELNVRTSSVSVVRSNKTLPISTPRRQNQLIGCISHLSTASFINQD